METNNFTIKISHGDFTREFITTKQHIDSAVDPVYFIGAYVLEIMKDLHKHVEEELYK